MTVDSFLKDPHVVSMIQELEAAGVPERQFSDVVDAQGHQYVDLVQEGGGTLGLALPGYTYVMESMGLRFFSLAGTSAGAINTMLMAAFGPRTEPVSAHTLRLLIQLYDRAHPDLKDFVDGPEYVRKSIDRALRDEKLISWRNPLTWPRARSLYRSYKWAKARLGLNPGDVFHSWIRSTLTAAGVPTLRALETRFAHTEGIRIRPEREDRADDILTPRLAIVATEITTESRILFPEMAPLFTAEPGSVHPADFVRASMAVPGFFEPFRWRIDPGIPAAEQQRLWRDWDRGPRFPGRPPDEALFVDGGVVSNFPIDVFHTTRRVPSRPTFGVKLGTGRSRAKDVTTLTGLAGASFNTARHILDYQFLLRNVDYEKLITRIDTGDAHWLNFQLTPEAMRDLFRAGAAAARDFLLRDQDPDPRIRQRAFNWKRYKELRKAQQSTTPAVPDVTPTGGDGDRVGIG